jgi:2-dehydropantoate 2-reductase
MRFVVFGAGAIGTYLGGSLVGAGYGVVFLDTAETVARIRQNGLALEDRGRTVPLPTGSFVSTWAEARRHEPFDAGIFALKSYDTKTAIGQLADVLHELPPIVCVQNGVDNEAELAAAVGEARVLHATVTSAISRPSPDRVVVSKARGVGLTARHALSGTLAAAFGQARLAPRLYADPLAMKWSKLLTNLMANASSAILEMLPEEIFREPSLFRMELEMMRECLRVMRAQHLSPVDLPHTPVRALAFAVERMPVFLAQLALSRVVGGGRGGERPSFYLDMQSGHGRTEVSWLNGAVVRAGSGVGVPTPINAVLTAVLLRISRDSQERERLRAHPSRLLAEIQAAQRPRR